MKLTKKQFRKIERLMPIPRKPPEISNYQFLCALLYMTENGCKWRALPKKFGKWHPIYMKFNRWSKNGTIQRIFEEMQRLNIIDIRTDTLCIDSTSIKVHPDAAEVLRACSHKAYPSIFSVYFAVGKYKKHTQCIFFVLTALKFSEYDSILANLCLVERQNPLENLQISFM